MNQLNQFLHDVLFSFILVNPFSGILWILGIMATMCFWIVMSSRLAGFKQPFDLADDVVKTTDAEKKSFLSKLGSKISGVLSNILMALWVSIKDIVATGKSFFVNKEKRAFISSAFVTYFAWGLIQQITCVLVYFFAQKFLIHEFGVLPGTIFAIIGTAVLFGVAHTPNFLLMFAVLSMELIYLTHWSFYHNFYALGLAHGFLGTCLLTFTTSELHHNFRIWIHYGEKV